LGCKLNFSESSTLAREFERGGFVRVAPTAEADICVINSCSVTEHADKKCRNLIRKLHRRNPEAIIAVTGCYAQLKPQEIAAIEGVDIVLSNNDKGALFKRVVELSGKGRAQVYSCETDSLTSFFAAFSSGDRTRAFLKVQDGCDYCCSYCTIHYARGSSRNMPVADLVAEARQIAAAEGDRPDGRQHGGFRPHDGGAVHRPAAGAQRGRRDRTLPHFVDRAEPADRRNHRILRRVA
jgi:MiaB-like-C: MiaB-like tRNA modifying enzyme